MTFDTHKHANEHTPLIHPHDQATNGTIIINSNPCINMVIKTDSSANKSTKRKLAIATTIALLFFATELIAGYFANSLGTVLGSVEKLFLMAKLF